MTIDGFRLRAPDIAYIGAGVTVKGAIVVPDAIIVDGVVEGDVTAQSIRIGPSGAIKGKVVSTDIDVSGTLAEKAVNDNLPANAQELDAPTASDQRSKIDAAE